MSKLDDLNTARLACYAEIRDCMKTRLLAFYGIHKEFLGDARSKDAISESLNGLDGIFAVLDKYEIVKKK